MNLPEPIRCEIAVDAGTMSGGNGSYSKRLSELAGLYRDRDAFDALLAENGDRIVYDVNDYRPSAAAGDLIFGLTRMSPGRVGAEYFLTRGHIHARADRPEIYYGQKGTGLMQMESPTGETSIIEIQPQTICYVPPFWIHRSINVGDDDLVMVFSYPADSGQDYGIIEKSGGMRHRVMATADGGWELVENADYVPRSPEAARAIFENAANMEAHSA